MSPPASDIRLRSRPLIPGGEGAGAEHAWDVRYVERLGVALDEVRADASPRIWETRDARGAFRLWAHLDGIAVAIDAQRGPFQHCGWIDGWQRSRNPYDMLTTVVGIVVSDYVTLAAVALAREVEHIAGPEAARYLDFVEHWTPHPLRGTASSNASEAQNGDESPRIDLLRHAEREDRRPETPESARVVAASYAAYFVAYLPLSTASHYSRALSISDTLEWRGGIATVCQDEARLAEAKQRGADIVRRAITIDLIVEGLILAKRRARENAAENILRATNRW